MIIVNQGHTDEVMDTARKAGARGGTVLKARFSGEEGAEHLHGFTLQQEKANVQVGISAVACNVDLYSVVILNHKGSAKCEIICRKSDYFSYFFVYLSDNMPI